MVKPSVWTLLMRLHCNKAWLSRQLHGTVEYYMATTFIVQNIHNILKYYIAHYPFSGFVGLCCYYFENVKEMKTFRGSFQSETAEKE